MIYVYGLVLSLLTGLSNSVVKKLTTNVKTGDYLFISSWLNLIGTILIYSIFLNNGIIQNFDVNNLGVSTVFVLIVYLLFRIFSNLCQTKLNSYEHINVNILNIVLSCTFFITIAIDTMLGTSYGAIILIGFLLSLIGIIIVTVDLKKSKFYFSRKEVFLLIVAFICVGTKPVMAKYLLNYIPISLLVLFECLNYAVIYTICNKSKMREIRNKDNKIMKLFLLQSIISITCLFLQFNAIADIKIYILTSFTTPIFTAIFAYLINKQIINKKTAFGIIIIILGICIAKLNI